jgi:AcrR family transcriptional regulator
LSKRLVISFFATSPYIVTLNANIGSASLKTSSLSKNPFPTIEPDTNDGRRLRSGRSRRRIIEAMFELLREGDMTPSAVAVAERANVGMRTVFRHFEDMDSIYDEMTQEVGKAITPMLVAPYETTSWHGRLFECLDRRAVLYETVFPMKMCITLRRFQSDFLRQQHDRDVVYLRAALKTILPEEITSNRELFGAIEAALDFSTWRQLRQDQKRSVESAKKSIHLVLEGLVAGIDVA